MDLRPWHVPEAPRVLSFSKFSGSVNLQARYVAIQLGQMVGISSSWGTMLLDCGKSGGTKWESHAE